MGCVRRLVRKSLAASTTKITSSGRKPGRYASASLCGLGEVMRPLKVMEGCGEEGWMWATLLKSSGQGLGVHGVWRREAGTQVSREDGGGKERE